MRLLVVCQDALDIHFYRKWQKQMPAHVDVMQSASVVADNGVISTWPIWTTFASGVSREKHGITTFCKTENGTRRMWRRDDINEAGFPLVFQQLNDMGLSVGWYALPVTSDPPCEINGFMVSSSVGVTGMESGVNLTWPEEAAQMLRVNRDMFNRVFSHRTFGSRPSPNAWKRASQRYLEDALKYEIATTESFIALAKEYDVDVGFVYFDKTDRIGHQCMDQPSIMLEMYRGCDNNLAKLRNELKPDHTMIISDHGMGVIPRRIVPINFPAQSKPGLDKTYIAGDHRNPGIIGGDFTLNKASYKMAAVKSIILGLF